MGKSVAQMTKEELVAYLTKVRPGSSFEGTKAELSVIALKVESVDAAKAKFPSLGINDDSPAELLEFLEDVASKDDTIDEQKAQIDQYEKDLATLNEKLASAEKEAAKASSSTGGVSVKFEGKRYKVVHGVTAPASQDGKIVKHTPAQIAANEWLLEQLIKRGSTAVVEVK